MDFDPSIAELVTYGTLGLVFGSVFAVVFGVMIVRTVLTKLPLARIELRRDWQNCEQRRYINRGANLRLLVSCLLAIVLLGGTVAAPMVLGFAEDLLWYLKPWWVGVLIFSLLVSIVAAFAITAVKPRCPRCRSLSLEKDYANGYLMYLCRPCQVVWRTMSSSSDSHDDGNTHHHHM